MNEQIFVDFDATLAMESTDWNTNRLSAGKPVPAMLERVKQWIRDGIQVTIFTARVSQKNSDWLAQREFIRTWLVKYLGYELPITASKEPGVLEYWDDKAVSVIPNTGMPACPNLVSKVQSDQPVNLKTKTACIVDNGIFTPWAITLAPSFKKMFYHFLPWKDAFAKSSSRFVGEGLPGVERLDDLFAHIDEIDLFIFTDIYHADLQEHLISYGKRVWGGRYGEDLELHRAETKELFKSLGMPTGQWRIITGISKLDEYLRRNEDKYIKISVTRGDAETFHHINYSITQDWLARKSWELGPRREAMEFIVEDPIPSDLEQGYDGFCIDGLYPTIAMQGYEIKDCGLLSSVGPYSALPEPVKWCNGKIAPVLASYNYRGFFSTEVRVGKDGKFYLIDPCCRCGSPPSELYQQQFSNWPEIIWHGAEGIMIEPVPVAKYGVEIMIHSGWSDKNWQAITFPPSILPFVKLKFSCRFDGVYYCAPQDMEIGQVGAVIGLGDTILDAIKHAKHNANMIQGHDIEIRFDSIPKALEEITISTKKYGYKFGNGAIPSPEDVSKVL